jgi:hypothetical protein
MKKTLLAIVSLVSLSFAHAQTQFGAKAGLNITTLSGDGATNFSSSIAVHAGMFANFAIDKKFSIQPEAVLSIEGAKLSIGATGRLSGTFINVPVLAQYNAGSGFILQTGPQIGLLMSANLKYTGEPSQNVKDLLKSTNFSWAFGTGFIPKASKVGFSLRYNLGLSNMFAGAGPTNRTSVWQIGSFIMLGK